MLLHQLRIDGSVVHVKLLMSDGGAAAGIDDFGRLIVVRLGVIVVTSVICADDATGGPQWHTHLIRGA